MESVLAQMNSYYRYNVDADGQGLVKIKALNATGASVPFWEGMTYDSVFPRAINLKDKMAGVDNPLRHKQLLGWSSPSLAGINLDRDGDGLLSPDEFIVTIMEVVAKNASGLDKEFQFKNGDLPSQTLQGAHVLDSGLDLAELSQKFLMGALSFSQAAGDYLSYDLDPQIKKGLYGDNQSLYKDRPFTVLQHHWDEAFGYFGAARNYLDYSDDQIQQGLSLDKYESKDVEDIATGQILYIDQSYGTGDGEISITAEKNFGLANYAGKLNKNLVEKSSENLSHSVMNHLLIGRQLVQERPVGYLPYVQAHAILALYHWERALAAASIHYINSLISDYQHFGSEQFHFKKMAAHFSELKGFALSFQFNPQSVLFINEQGVKVTDRFLELHMLIGDFPKNPNSGDIQAYQADLLAARKLLQETYHFSNEDAEAL